MDKNNEGGLSKPEIVKILKEAEVSGFIRGLVLSMLIERYDFSNDDKIGWSEFKKTLKEMNK